MKPYCDLSPEQKQRRIVRATAWNKANRAKSAASMRRNRYKTYGVDVVEADAVMTAHDGKCDCCGALKPGGRFGWNLDHDHVTGRVRGVLCFKCNVGIGKLGDTLEGVLRAVKYLTQQS